jgi:hypothetical protein
MIFTSSKFSLWNYFRGDFEIKTDSIEKIIELIIINICGIFSVSSRIF